MTIPIRGILRIKRIVGSNGPFCVGSLETEIGEFRVKDALLDQFDEGTYKGMFWINQIYPSSYSTAGRMVIEVRAKLADVQIDAEDLGKVPDEKGEPDPAGEPPSEQQPPKPAMMERKVMRKKVVVVPPPERAHPETPSEPQQPTNDAPAHDDSKPAQKLATNPDEDLNLFGRDLFSDIEECKPVKLDPTIDRMRFRLQRDRLKALGYAFSSTTQCWQLPA